MSYKRTTFSWPRRLYTTKKMREMTEQRRLKEEAELKIVPPPLPATEISQITEEIKTAPSKLPDSNVKEVNAKPIKSRNLIPARVCLVLTLLFIAFSFIVSSKFSGSWVNAVAAKFNALIVQGSFFILSIIQRGFIVKGLVLNGYYYKISLQGDLVPFYSLEFLVVLAVLFSFFQKMPWIKRGRVFIFLVPLAVIANILGVVTAFGLAFNYGAAYADRYFQGVLAGFVFIFIVLGLIFLEFVFSSD